MKGTWSNTDNMDFYNHFQLDNFVASAGLASGVDVDLAETFMADKDEAVLEIGASTGRVVGHLLQKGFTNVHALERSKWVQTIESRYSDAIDHGLLMVHHCDLQTFDPAQKFDTILWLFCGITDFCKAEQKLMLAKLRTMLKPGGRVIVDLPLGQTNASLMNGREHAIHQEGAPSYHGHVPTVTEMQLFALTLGYGNIERKDYVTESGRDRGLFILHEQYV